MLLLTSVCVLRCLSRASSTRWVRLTWPVCSGWTWSGLVTAPSLWALWPPSTSSPRSSSNTSTPCSAPAARLHRWHPDAPTPGQVQRSASEFSVGVSSEAWRRERLGRRLQVGSSQHDQNTEHILLHLMEQDVFCVLCSVFCVLCSGRVVKIRRLWLFLTGQYLINGLQRVCKQIWWFVYLSADDEWRQ